MLYYRYFVPTLYPSEVRPEPSHPSQDSYLPNFFTTLPEVRVLDTSGFLLLEKQDLGLIFHTPFLFVFTSQPQTSWSFLKNRIVKIDRFANASVLRTQFKGEIAARSTSKLFIIIQSQVRHSRHIHNCGAFSIGLTRLQSWIPGSPQMAQRVM